VQSEEIPAAVEHLQGGEMQASSTGAELRPMSQAPGVCRRSRERGTVHVEFALVLLPFLALVMFIVDTAWVIFAQATIQSAVREGVRVGITATAASSCSTASPPTLTCTIQDVVHTYSFGFVAASNVQVTYYSTSSGTLTQVTGTGADTGGNIVQVSVSNITVKSMGALLRHTSPINLAATASDVIESNSSPSTP
jgi:Flp pilus assembly protein TadG